MKARIYQDVEQETLFPYAQAEYEELPCNLCGHHGRRGIARRDRNGLSVRSVICTQCGLMYLSPRMTPQWYSLYYQKEYRRQMSAFKRTEGKKAKSVEVNYDKMFRAQALRGQWLADYLVRHAAPPRTALEVGSSTGGMLHALAERFGCRVQGVEPSGDEAAFASAHGVPTQIGLFEQLELAPHQQFDLVICTQSFNHLLDPHTMSQRIRQCLSPQGVFYLECQDFFSVLNFRGTLEQAIQIDHVFMFVPSTLRAIVEMAGFEVDASSMICDRALSVEEREAQKNAGMPTLHVRFLARPGRPTASPSSAFSDVYAELCELERSLATERARLRYTQWFDQARQTFERPLRSLARIRRAGRDWFKRAA